LLEEKENFVDLESLKLELVNPRRTIKKAMEQIKIKETKEAKEED